MQVFPPIRPLLSFRAGYTLGVIPILFLSDDLHLINTSIFLKSKCYLKIFSIQGTLLYQLPFNLDLDRSTLFFKNTFKIFGFFGNKVYLLYRDKKHPIKTKMETKIEIKPIINFYSKEIQIMRQSQQKMAFDYSKSKGYIPTIVELQRMTDLFVEVCLRPQDENLTKRIKSLDTWLNEQIQKKMDNIEIDGILI